MAVEFYVVLPLGSLCPILAESFGFVETDAQNFHLPHRLFLLGLLRVKMDVHLAGVFVVGGRSTPNVHADQILQEKARRHGGLVVLLLLLIAALEPLASEEEADAGRGRWWRLDTSPTAARRQ